MFCALIFIIPAEDAAKIFKYHFSFTGSFELHTIVVHIFFYKIIGEIVILVHNFSSIQTNQE